MTARGRLGMLLVALLLGAPALSACGSDEEPLFQRVAFCQGQPGDNSADGRLVVEWRQGSEVVATASGPVGTVFTAEVPIGGIQVYVDGVQVGAVNEGVDTSVFASPGPDDVTYVSSEGCPDDPLP